MSTPNPVTSAVNAGAKVGIHLPPVVQHVLDSLEAHLGAVLSHAKTASPGATAVIADFGDQVLDKLDSLGVEFRTELQSFRAKIDALKGPTPTPVADQGQIGLRPPGVLMGTSGAAGAPVGAFQSSPAPDASASTTSAGLSAAAASK
jgi:hypothetical protein